MAPANGRTLQITPSTFVHAPWDSVGRKRALLRGTLLCASPGANVTSFLQEEVRGTHASTGNGRREVTSAFVSCVYLLSIWLILLVWSKSERGRLK